MRTFTALCAVLAFAASAAFGGQIRIIDDAQDVRPAVWKAADGQSVLRAETVARLDAWAKLAEFVGGMEIKGVASVRDMVSVEQGIRGLLRTRIGNMSTEELIHYENGVVQCVISAKLSDIVESVESYLREEKVDEKVVSREAFKKYNMDKDDRVIEIWGNGGLEGTEGVEIVQAIRAAELSALEQMVAKLEGVQIGRETVVGDFVLASDRIKTCVDDFSKGVQYTEYDILDKTVEVEAQMTFVTVIERIERVYEEINSLNLCTGCPIVEKREFEQTTRHEEAIVHQVVGKAARVPGGVQTRAPNAERAMREARAAAGSKAEVTYESVQSGGSDKVIRREVIEEKVVGEKIGVGR